MELSSDSGEECEELRLTDAEASVTRSVYSGDIDYLLADAQSDEFGSDLGDNYRFYDVDCGRVLLVMNEPCRLHLYGCFGVKAIAGRAELCGYLLDRTRPRVEMYSCEGSSALYLSTSRQDGGGEPVDICAMGEFGLPLMESTKIRHAVGGGGCVLLLTGLRKLELVGETRAGRTATGRLGVRLDTPRCCIKNKLVLPPELTRLTDVAGVTVLCGGKGVGKSTSLRYLANRCLNTTDRLLYVDLDIGQPEFTLHECVSATLVDAPLLGPCYTHPRRPAVSLCVGHTDVARCVVSYLRAVEALVASCRSSYGDMPWLVNTMGFTRGVGVYINSSVLAILSPTLVVQIEGSKAQNFPSDLTREFVELESGRPVSHYNLLKVMKRHAKAKDSYSAMLSNKEMRWIATESYFSSASRPSHPLVCPADLVSVFDMTTRLQIPQLRYSALVGKIVVLSSSDSQSDCPVALDHGVVLAYAESEKHLLIYTPLEPCSRVRSVLVGSLQIPGMLNRAVPPRFSGLVPYAVLSQYTADSTPTVRPLRRQYRFLFETPSRSTATAKQVTFT